MKFEKYLPTEQLRSYIKYFVVSESRTEKEYKVFPSSGLVIGFQYRGQLSTVKHKAENKLAPSGITGISDSFMTFKSSENIGTILVYFTETGFANFSVHPANMLFNLNISLDEIFPENDIEQLEEKLSFASTDRERLRLVELFFLSQLKSTQTDRLVGEAVRLIYKSKGSLRIKELNEALCISQSPLEKRFRRVVGTTPKKFASIVRFNSVLNEMDSTTSLMDICHENSFFDQAHFSKVFKQFTGDTPENFRRHR